MYYVHFQNNWFRRTGFIFVTIRSHSFNRWIPHSQRQILQQKLARPSTKKMPKSAPGVQSPFAAYTDSTTVLYHVFIGVCSASFWRGAWYILDDILFPQSKELSAFASLMLGTAGMLSVQGLFERIEKYSIQLMKCNDISWQHKWISTRSLQHIHSMLRFTTIYLLVLSVVCVWRGTWMTWDILYAKYFNDYASGSRTGIASSTDANVTDERPDSETINASDPGHALRSGLMSHYSAVIVLSCLGIVASVFAPPAAISVIRDSTIFSTKTNIERMLYPKKYSQRIASNKYLPQRSKYKPSWWHQRRTA